MVCRCKGTRETAPRAWTCPWFCLWRGLDPGACHWHGLGARDAPPEAHSCQEHGPAPPPAGGARNGTGVGRGRAKPGPVCLTLSLEGFPSLGLPGETLWVRIPLERQAGWAWGGVPRGAWAQLPGPGSGGSPWGRLGDWPALTGPQASSPVNGSLRTLAGWAPEPLPSGSPTLHPEQTLQGRASLASGGGGWGGSGSACRFQDTHTAAAGPLWGRGGGGRGGVPAHWGSLTCTGVPGQCSPQGPRLRPQRGDCHGPSTQALSDMSPSCGWPRGAQCQLPRPRGPSGHQAARHLAAGGSASIAPGPWPLPSALPPREPPSAPSVSTPFPGLASAPGSFSPGQSQAPTVGLAPGTAGWERLWPPRPVPGGAGRGPRAPGEGVSADCFGREKGS